MRVPTFIPRTGATLDAAADWIRNVTAVLNGGATLADQLAGEVVSFRYNSDAPPTVPTKLRTAPVAVVVLAAKPVQPQVIDQTLVIGSCLPVIWGWAPTQTRGAVRILEVKYLDDSVDYDVSLWLVGGA